MLISSSKASLCIIGIIGSSTWLVFPPNLRLWQTSNFLLCAAAVAFWWQRRPNLLGILVFFVEKKHLRHPRLQFVSLVGALGCLSVFFIDASGRPLDFLGSWSVFALRRWIRSRRTLPLRSFLSACQISRGHRLLESRTSFSALHDLLNSDAPYFSSARPNSRGRRPIDTERVVTDASSPHCHGASSRSVIGFIRHARLRP